MFATVANVDIIFGGTFNSEDGRDKNPGDTVCFVFWNVKTTFFLHLIVKKRLLNRFE